MSKGHCGLKRHCKSVLPYEALCARAGDGACSSMSERAANKTAWEKKKYHFFCSVLSKWPGGMCVHLQSHGAGRVLHMSALHLIVYAVTPGDEDFPHL